MNRILNFYLIMAFWAMLAVPLSGQQSGGQYNPKRYKKDPVWIQMMQDPDANYFETVKAFREFWEGFQLPGEPEELEGHDSFEKEVGLDEAGDEKEKKHEKEKRKRKNKAGNDYAFEVKQFRGWFRDVQPWVQPDGHILNETERQQLIDRQQEELRAIESNQKH